MNIFLYLINVINCILRTRVPKVRTLALEWVEEKEIRKRSTILPWIVVKSTLIVVSYFVSLEQAVNTLNKSTLLRFRIPFKDTLVIPKSVKRSPGFTKLRSQNSEMRFSVVHDVIWRMPSKMHLRISRPPTQFHHYMLQTA